MRTRMILVLMLFVAAAAFAQEAPWFNWTLMEDELMDEIIGESSGETAWNTTAALGGSFNRNRPHEEYQGLFFEAEYILQQLKLYGLAGAKIETFAASGGRFGGSGKTWDGIKGELWEVSPQRQKLASYQDMRAMLMSGSKNADVRAELVWVDRGIPLYMDSVDVKGKIVVTLGSPRGAISNGAVAKGALGFISISDSRIALDPLQIPIRGLPGQAAELFGFWMSFRDGQPLIARLKGGEKITVHAEVEAKMEDYELQCPTAYIQGTDPEAGEVLLSAHLFEGYTKQGANDNMSGSATILEAARTLNELIKSGRIPQPKRTIRFIWAPEFSGTIPWVNAHKELMAKTLCNINVDMAGEWLSLNMGKAQFSHTTYANAHYINDVMENYFRYVGQVTYEVYPQGVQRQIVAPTGSNEPFIYGVEWHSGGSDHEVFNDWGVKVPGVSMNVWPDQWYHTSGDRIDKSDPTQLKRMSIIGAAGAYTIATADQDMALKLAAEAFSNSQRTLGRDLVRAFEQLNRADAESFGKAVKLAFAIIAAGKENEINSLQSIIELAPDSALLKSYLETVVASIGQNGESNLVALTTYSKVVSRKLSIPDFQFEPTAEELAAGKMVYAPTAKVLTLGAFGHSAAVAEVDAAKLEELKYSRRDIASTAELNALINGKRSVLELKMNLDAQYSRTTSLVAITKHLKQLELAGLISLVK